MTCSLYKEQTRLRRWQFFVKFDFSIGITIIVETNKKSRTFSVDGRGSSCDMDSEMYQDIFATEFVDMFPQTNGDILLQSTLVRISSRKLTSIRTYRAMLRQSVCCQEKRNKG